MPSKRSAQEAFGSIPVEEERATDASVESVTNPMTVQSAECRWSSEMKRALIIARHADELRPIFQSPQRLSNKSRNEAWQRVLKQWIDSCPEASIIAFHNNANSNALKRIREMYYSLYEQYKKEKAQRTALIMHPANMTSKCMFYELFDEYYGEQQIQSEPVQAVPEPIIQSQDRASNSQTIANKVSGVKRRLIAESSDDEDKDDEDDQQWNDWVLILRELIHVMKQFLEIMASTVAKLLMALSNRPPPQPIMYPYPYSYPICYHCSHPFMNAVPSVSASQSSRQMTAPSQPAFAHSQANVCDSQQRSS
jgi:hypothetical protein